MTTRERDDAAIRATVKTIEALLTQAIKRKEASGFIDFGPVLADLIEYARADERAKCVEVAFRYNDSGNGMIIGEAIQEREG